MNEKSQLDYAVEACTIAANQYAIPDATQEARYMAADDALNELQAIELSALNNEERTTLLQTVNYLATLLTRVGDPTLKPLLTQILLINVAIGLS